MAVILFLRCNKLADNALLMYETPALAIVYP